MTSLEATGHRKVGQHVDSEESKARAAELRAAGHTYREIADELGVHNVTVYRWLTEPETRAAVRSLTSQLGEMLLYKVARNVDKALEVQHQVLEGSETDRLKANTANSLVLSFLQRMSDVQLDDD